MQHTVYDVYIFGCGNEYNRLSSYLDLYKEQINILGIVTSKKQPFETMDGIQTLSIEEMKVEIADYIIVAVKEWKQIVEILYTYGVREEQILRSSIFYYPHFDLDKYVQLKKSNISIIANSCVGG